MKVSDLIKFEVGKYQPIVFSPWVEYDESTLIMMIGMQEQNVTYRIEQYRLVMDQMILAKKLDDPKKANYFQACGVARINMLLALADMRNLIIRLNKLNLKCIPTK